MQDVPLDEEDGAGGDREEPAAAPARHTLLHVDDPAILWILLLPIVVALVLWLFF
jgi:hypothetical protein